jgi:peptidylprolyl isomerase
MAAALALGCALAATAPAQAQTAAEVLAASPAEDWRGLDLESTLVMTLGSGRQVIIEMNPTFAPNTIANIRTLARANFWDGLSINRVQDNYVTQWGDGNAETPEARSLGAAARTIAPEFVRPRDRAVPFTRLRDGDVYAREVGFSNGFPVARNARQMWMTHCNGMIGVGRDTAPDSGSGAELYAVIGHAPRHLDRNITLVGRVITGMDALSALPRGTGALGFYETPEERVTIRSVRIAADLPDGGPAGRLQVLRTDSATFTQYVETRRNRRDDWFFEPAGRIEICNVWLPSRQRPG